MWIDFSIGVIKDSLDLRLDLLLSSDCVHCSCLLLPHRLLGLSVGRKLSHVALLLRRRASVLDVVLQDLVAVSPLDNFSFFKFRQGFTQNAWLEMEGRDLSIMA